MTQNTHRSWTLWTTLRSLVTGVVLFSLVADSANAFSGYSTIASIRGSAPGIHQAVFAGEALAAGALLERHTWAISTFNRVVDARAQLLKKVRLSSFRWIGRPLKGIALLFGATALGRAAELVTQVTTDGTTMTVTKVAVVEKGDYLIRIADQLNLPKWFDSLYTPNAAHIDADTYVIQEGQRLVVEGTTNVIQLTHPATFVPKLDGVVEFVNPLYFDPQTFWIAGAVLLLAGVAVYVWKKKKAVLLPFVLAGLSLIVAPFQWPLSYALDPKAPAPIHQTVKPAPVVEPAPVASPVVRIPRQPRVTAVPSVAPPHTPDPTDLQDLPSGKRIFENTLELFKAGIPQTVPETAEPPAVSATVAAQAQAYLQTLLEHVQTETTRDALETLTLEAIVQSPLPEGRVRAVLSLVGSYQIVQGRDNVNRLGPSIEGTIIPKTGGPSQKTQKALKENAALSRQSEAARIGDLARRETAGAIGDWLTAREQNPNDVEEAETRLLRFVPQADLALLATLPRQVLDTESLRAREPSGARAERAALNVVRTLLETRAASESRFQILIRYYLQFNVFNPTADILNLMKWGALPELRLRRKVDWEAAAKRVSAAMDAFETEETAANGDPAFELQRRRFRPLVAEFEDALRKARLKAPKKKNSQQTGRVSIRQGARLNAHGNNSISNLDTSGNVGTDASILTSGYTPIITVNTSRQHPAAGAPVSATGTLGVAQSAFLKARQLRTAAGGERPFSVALSQVFSLNNPEGPASFTRSIALVDVTQWVGRVSAPVQNAVIHRLFPRRELKRRFAREVIADSAVQQAILSARVAYLKAREKRSADLAGWETFLAQDFPNGSPWAEFQKALRALDGTDLSSIEVAIARERLSADQHIARFGPAWIALSSQVYEVINSRPGINGVRQWTQTTGFTLGLTFSPRQRAARDAAIARAIDESRRELADAERRAAIVHASRSRAVWAQAEAEAVRQLAAFSNKANESRHSSLKPMEWNATLIRADDQDVSIRSLVEARLGPESHTPVSSRLDPRANITSLFGRTTGVQGIKPRGFTVQGGQFVFRDGGRALAEARAQEAAQKLAQKRRDEARRNLDRAIREKLKQVARFHQQVRAGAEDYQAALADWKEAGAGPITLAATHLSRATHRLYEAIGRLEHAIGSLNAEFGDRDPASFGFTSVPFSVHLEGFVFPAAAALSVASPASVPVSESPSNTHRLRAAA